MPSSSSTASSGPGTAFGPNGGTAIGGLLEYRYEPDLFGGFTLTYGKLSLTTSYTLLSSRRNAFQEGQEFGFTLALDDSELDEGAVAQAVRHPRHREQL